MVRSATGNYIAIRGPQGNVLLFWPADRSTVWHRRGIGFGGTAFSNPAIIRSAHGTEFVFPGPNQTLWFCWNHDGPAIWPPAHRRGLHRACQGRDHQDIARHQDRRARVGR
jgi:hypothetical protein